MENYQRNENPHNIKLWRADTRVIFNSRTSNDVVVIFGKNADVLFLKWLILKCSLKLI